MPPKVPHGHKDLHFGADVNPVPVPEDGSGGRAGAEKVALGGRHSCTQGMKVPKGSSVSSLHLAGMAWANAKHQQIIQFFTKKNVFKRIMSYSVNGI